MSGWSPVSPITTFQLLFHRLFRQPVGKTSYVFFRFFCFLEGHVFLVSFFFLLVVLRYDFCCFQMEVANQFLFRWQLLLLSGNGTCLVFKDFRSALVNMAEHCEIIASW